MQTSGVAPVCSRGAQPRVSCFTTCRSRSTPHRRMRCPSVRRYTEMREAAPMLTLTSTDCQALLGKGTANCSVALLNGEKFVERKKMLDRAFNKDAVEVYWGQIVKIMQAPSSPHCLRLTVTLCGGTDENGTVTVTLCHHTVTHCLTVHAISQKYMESWVKRGAVAMAKELEECVVPHPHNVHHP